MEQEIGDEREEQHEKIEPIDPCILEAQITLDTSSIEVEKNGRYETVQEKITDEDRALSALMIYHESRGESEDGQRAVAEVLCNRILSDLYPDTAKEVISFAKFDFDKEDQV